MDIGLWTYSHVLLILTTFDAWPNQANYKLRSNTHWRGQFSPASEYCRVRWRLALALPSDVWAIYCPANLRRTGQRNLEIAFPEMPEGERKRLLRGCFASLGRLLGEFSQLPKATPEKLRQLIEYDEVGLAHLREAEKNKRGVIFLTGHLGCWELHSFGWSALEYPLSFLVRPLDNRAH